METGITFTFAAIFLGAALLSSIALYAKQPIIIAHRAWRGSRAAWAGRCVRYGPGLRRRPRGHHPAPVPARPRYEARRAMEQLASVYLVALISAVVFASTGYGLSLALLQWLGCHPHQRRTGVFINDYRH